MPVLLSQCVIRIQFWSNNCLTSVPLPLWQKFDTASGTRTVPILGPKLLWSWVWLTPHAPCTFPQPSHARLLDLGQAEGDPALRTALKSPLLSSAGSCPCHQGLTTPSVPPTVPPGSELPICSQTSRSPQLVALPDCLLPDSTRSRQGPSDALQINLVRISLPNLCFTLLFFFPGGELFSSYMGVTVVTVTRQKHTVRVETVLHLWTWIRLGDF